MRLCLPLVKPLRSREASMPRGHRPCLCHASRFFPVRHPHRRCAIDPKSKSPMVGRFPRPRGTDSPPVTAEKSCGSKLPFRTEG